MASQISDPKDFARHVSEPMLGLFLATRNPPIPFEVQNNTLRTSGRKRVPQDVVERFIKTIEDLNDKDRAERLFNEMLYINHLSDVTHIEHLENQATQAGVSFITDDEYNKCECNDERALWWYVRYPDIFEKYFERSETENIAGLKEFIIPDKHIIPKEDVTDDTKIVSLGSDVARVYQNVLRGKKFRSTSFPEKDCVMLRVYLENLPSNQLVFVDGKETQATIERAPSIRSLFNNLFVYNPKQKTLGIRTNNPKENVPKLAEIFCRTFLGCGYIDLTEQKYNVESKDSIRKLDLLVDPADDDIEQCYLKAVEYKQKGNATQTIRIDVGSSPEFKGTAEMEKALKKVFKKESANDKNGGSKESDWLPKKFEIKFVFKKTNSQKGRKRQVTAHLTKRGVGLKNTPEDHRVREFLIEKGFIG